MRLGATDPREAPRPFTLSIIRVLGLIGMAVALGLSVRALLLLRGIGGPEVRRSRERILGVSLLIAAALVGRLLPGRVDDTIVTGGILALGVPGLVFIYFATRRQSA
jgi:hypothetical protein